jgi:hypothetical protein
VTTWLGRRRQRWMLAALADGQPHFAFDLAREAHVLGGGTYITLWELEQAGKVVSWFLDGPEPRRRVYQLAAIYE